MLATETPTLRWITVKMADNEWDNGENMSQIARERFASDDNPESLLVEVREHAGWFAEYGWDGDIVLLGTANRKSDSPRANAYRERHVRKTFDCIGSEDR
jgi:hypothetical protein